jgi:hypothetical protein
LLLHMAMFLAMFSMVTILGMRIAAHFYFFLYFSLLCEVCDRAWTRGARVCCCCYRFKGVGA